ncbi:MAG: TRAP transporter small permease subunit [Paracoccaceae bacterium]
MSTRPTGVLRGAAEGFAAALMGLMFATFILQVAIRYSARSPWIAETLPWLNPAHFGWTLEFCLVLWVWLIFWGNAFVVRDRDHVSFDVLFLAAPRGLRRGFAVLSGLAIAGGLLVSAWPTWERFAILRLKKTATLADLFGDWVRMRDIYIVYMLFLVVVAARYGWKAWVALRHDRTEADDPVAGEGRG